MCIINEYEEKECTYEKCINVKISLCLYGHQCIKICELIELCEFSHR